MVFLRNTTKQPGVPNTQPQSLTHPTGGKHVYKAKRLGLLTRSLVAPSRPVRAFSRGNCEIRPQTSRQQLIHNPTLSHW